MTYDYDEFMSQFAGVNEYNCGGSMKKIKKVQGGAKTKQNPVKKENKKSTAPHPSTKDDANDDALLDFLNYDKKSNDKSVKENTTANKLKKQLTKKPNR